MPAAGRDVHDCPRDTGMIYNLAMARILKAALGLVILFSICLIGRAQAPRAVPAKGLPEVHLRVDTSLVLVPVHYSSEEAGVEWWKNEKLLITFRTELLKYVYYRLKY